MPQNYKLSPSDFKYLWEDCKFCFYQKVKNGNAYYGPFPAIFGRLNTLLQDSVMGKSLQDIDPSLPGGTIEFQEGFLKSQPIPGAPDCYISGRFDVMTKLDDGSYGVIDFKITKPDEEQIQKFSSQLHAYKFALENPAVGNPIKISKIGLISVSPESIEHKDGKFVFTTSPTWHPLEENMEGFFSLIKEISDLLNGPLPAVSETCQLCVYREKFNKKGPVQNDLPF